METASRTLVKSPPEVWEQLDHLGRMQGLMSALVGHATDIEVYERVEESRLAWKSADEARIEFELAEKGWGTNVSVSAENGDQSTKLEGWLDAVLEELATPQKRPFESMTEPHEPPAPVEIAPVQEPAAVEAVPSEEPPAAEEPQPEVETPAEPEPEEAPAAAEAPRPIETLRRFLGIDDRR
jgi:outer membrane biosynthesis protein TonB